MTRSWRTVKERIKEMAEILIVIATSLVVAGLYDICKLAVRKFCKK